MKKFLFTACILIFGIHHSQTYYSQDFNTAAPDLNNWVSADLDGDGKQWTKVNASGINPNFGTGSIISRSYQNNQALTPDNLITSPLIDLSTVTAANAFLKYDLYTVSDDPEEKYSVYVTTSNVSTSITSAVPIHTETVAQGGFQTRWMDLTSFIGQQVYVSFRHYECTDHYYLIIDNVELKTIVNPSAEAALTKIDLGHYGVINTDYPIKATIKNTGVRPINNITINWNDGTDHISTIQLPSPIISGLKTTISLPTPVNYASLVEKNINISITEVNGSLDSTPADNTLITKFNTVSQNSPKKVVIEEGTGTWCGWCPRGAVAMHSATNTLANDFIGITVHNNDPMMLSAYNTGANFSGFPSMNIDRSLLDQGVDTDFSPVIIERKKIIAPAALNAASTLAGRALTFNASAIFRTNFASANFRFAAVVIEDEVKGTVSGYNQTNYYAGGGNGVMGGYETKPNPVPAADMVYDHVGRMLLGGYAGQVGSVPTSITDGQTVNYTFTADIPAAYNIDKIKVVLLLLDAATGEIVNAAGPFSASGTLGVNTVQAQASDLAIYPNPANDYIKVQAKGKVDLKIFDVNGRIVIERSDVEPNASVSTQNLVKGVYLVSIKEKGSEPKTRKLIIK